MREFLAKPMRNSCVGVSAKDKRSEESRFVTTQKEEALHMSAISRDCRNERKIPRTYLNPRPKAVLFILNQISYFKS